MSVASLLGLVGWLALAFAAGAVGAAASFDAAAFYAQLVRPTWAPPARAFGPVWTVLYALMGTAAWLVWRERKSRPVRAALALFVAQLVVNALWSWLFFRSRNGAAAFGDVVLLLVLIVLTAVAFAKVSRGAAWLMVPYLAWVSFAGALNLAVWRLTGPRPA
jgi:tryptophan-rich sensory protein